MPDTEAVVPVVPPKTVPQGSVSHGDRHGRPRGSASDASRGPAPAQSQLTEIVAAACECAYKQGRADRPAPAVTTRRHSLTATSARLQASLRATERSVRRSRGRTSGAQSTPMTYGILEP